MCGGGGLGGGVGVACRRLCEFQGVVFQCVSVLFCFV